MNYFSHCNDLKKLPTKPVNMEQLVKRWGQADIVPNGAEQGGEERGGGAQGVGDVGVQRV